MALDKSTKLEDEDHKKLKRSQRQPLLPLKSYMKPKLQSCKVYAVGLGQSHVGFLIVDLFSENPYEPRLVDCVCFLVLFLTPLTPTILRFFLLQNSQKST